MKILLKLYYLLSIVPLVYHIRRVLNSDITKVSNDTLLSNFESEYLLLFISLISLITWVVVSFSPQSRVARVLFSVGFYCICFTEYSFGKIDHYTHSWLYLNFFFIFIDKDFKNSSKVLEASKYLLLSIYAIAGSWKLISMIKVLKIKNLSEASLDIIGNAIAAGILPISGMGRLLIEFENLILIGFILILIFQIANYSILFTNKYLNHLGYVAILFHLLTGLTLGIYYLPTILCIIIIFPIQNLIREHYENNFSS